VLTAGADSKRKRYAAAVWVSEPHTAEQLRAKLEGLKDVQVRTCVSRWAAGVSCGFEHRLPSASPSPPLPITTPCLLQVSQRTPVRVLHRRTLLSRPKVMHELRVAAWADPHHFTLELLSSAGAWHAARGRAWMQLVAAALAFLVVSLSTRVSTSPCSALQIRSTSLQARTSRSSCTATLGAPAPTWASCW
jgi:uncharacterized membrane protein (DUF2068 family)